MGRIRYLTEERAYDLALRVAHTPGYNVLDVRRAWSAMHSWQVEIEDCQSGERILLLNDDQFDSHLQTMEGNPITTEEPIEDSRACGRHVQ